MLVVVTDFTIGAALAAHLQQVVGQQRERLELVHELGRCRRSRRCGRRRRPCRAPRLRADTRGRRRRVASRLRGIGSGLCMPGKAGLNSPRISMHLRLAAGEHLAQVARARAVHRVGDDAEAGVAQAVEVDQARRGASMYGGFGSNIWTRPRAFASSSGMRATLVAVRLVDERLDLRRGCPAGRSRRTRCGP